MTFERQIGQSQPFALPYRVGVGIMLFNAQGLVWTGRRLPKWAEHRSAFVWQMPQGGLVANEEPLDAAYRELEEETGIRSVEFIAELNQWLTYDLLSPDDAGNRAISRASASAMLTMVGIVILLIPLLRRTWRDHKGSSH